VVGALRINVPARDARLRERRVELSQLEFNLLCKLASDPSRVFGKDELLRDVWHGRLARTRTLDSHACRLAESSPSTASASWRTSRASATA
jgi:DNA-binding response OmpR family regulator